MRAWQVILSLIVALASVGCGGGGTGQAQNPIVFTETRTIDQAGGQIDDAQRGIKLIVPPNALTQATSVTLEVRQNQRNGVTPPNWTTNSNSIDVGLDPASMAPEGQVDIVIPHPPLAGDQSQLVLATDDSGNIVPVESDYDAGLQAFKGHITKDHLEDFGRSRTRSLSPGLGFFLGIVSEALSQVRGDWYILENGNLRAANANDRMTASCTAVVIHGILDDKDDVKPLAQYLFRSDIAPPPPGQRAYEAVWIYDYNWKSGIRDSAEEFAGDLLDVVGTGKVDIWAHSMGGLVARWAIEKEQIGDEVKRLFTFGTPHEGVPGWIGPQFLAYVLSVPVFPGLKDLIAESSFMEDLNGVTSPYAGEAEYYTLCGTSHLGASYYNAIHRAYNFFGGGGEIECDGIVPVYSAQSYVLQNKSDYWFVHTSALATVALNHSDLRSLSGGISPLVEQIVSDPNRDWLRPCGGSGAYEYLDLHPNGASSSAIYGCSDDGQWQVGAAYFGGDRHAGLWSGSSTSFVDLHPGPGSSTAYDISNDGQWQVGSYQPPSQYRHPTLWRSTASSAMDLTPSSAYPGEYVTGEATAISRSGAYQLGAFESWPIGGYSAISHACRWQGQPLPVETFTSQYGNTNYAPNFARTTSADGTKAAGQMYTFQGWHAAYWPDLNTLRDLHPAGFLESTVNDMSAGGGVIVGSATLSNGRHGMIWTGQEGVFTDLHPFPFLSSETLGVSPDGTVQVGMVISQAAPLIRRAALWRGAAQTYEDLHSSLPAMFVASEARCIDSNGRIYGEAFDSTGWGHAVMWTPR